MQYIPFEPNIEVNGQTIYAVVDGFRLFRRIASALLQQEGIGLMRLDGDLEIDREGWYSQAAWLRAFARIAEEAGTELAASAFANTGCWLLRFAATAANGWDSATGRPSSAVAVARIAESTQWTASATGA